jgi:hypothetical protein
VSHLHSLQSYTSVTAITYYTLTLVDFSAINYFLKLSQTLHLHTSKLPPQTYSANSLLKTATSQLTRRTAPYKTDCLDISVPLINPQSYERHCCLLPGPSRSSEPGEGSVTSLAETRRSRDITLLVVRMTSSRLRGEDPASPTAA